VCRPWLGARGERLVHVHGVDPALPQRVLGNRKTDLDQLDVFLRVHTVFCSSIANGP